MAPPQGPPPAVVQAPDGPPPPVYYAAPPQQQPPPGYAPGPYTSSTYAQPPPQSEPAPSKGAYVHDGFYLRMGIGIGRMGATFDNSESRERGLEGSVEGSIASVAGAFEFALGGTPAPGLVIGGGIFSGFTGKVETSDLEVNGRAVSPLKHDQTSFALVGPFIDYYFDERSGFHLQGALGLTAMEVGAARSLDGATVTPKRTLGGLGFMLGGGWEAFVGEQWSLGGVARVRYGALETDDDDDERYTFRALAIPEILFTATYH